MTVILFVLGWLLALGGIIYSNITVSFLGVITIVVVFSNMK